MTSVNINVWRNKLGQNCVLSAECLEQSRGLISNSFPPNGKKSREKSRGQKSRGMMRSGYGYQNSTGTHFYFIYFLSFNNRCKPLRYTHRLFLDVTLCNASSSIVCGYCCEVLSGVDFQLIVVSLLY